MSTPPTAAFGAGLEHKRFLIVTGKGGVGKTTVSAATALALAQKGRRVLIAMCHAKERISTMFGSAPVGTDVTAVAPNIWAVNMDPEEALTEYGQEILRSKALTSLLFDNKYVRALFAGVPGMHEWAMLGKAWWHTTEKGDDGRARFDVVILDAPATGHGVDMLRVPKVILDVVPPGILRRDAERAWEMFRDAERSAVVLVTLPEEMPVSETIELATTLRMELEIPIGRLVVNQLLPPLFDAAERAALTAAAIASDDPRERSVLESGRMRAMREQVQAESLARLSRELPVRPSFLPLLFSEASQPEAIRELAKRLA